MKSNEEWSSQLWSQFLQLRKEAWKKNSGLQRGLNPWPRDTGATLYQLSYEATDVGSRSILGSFVPVKDMKVNDAYEINHTWTADMKSNEEWSSQLWSQFLQLRKEAWKKFRTSTGLEPVTSRYRCDALQPLTLGAGPFWVHMFPWKINSVCPSSCVVHVFLMTAKTHSSFLCWIYLLLGTWHSKKQGNEKNRSVKEYLYCKHDLGSGV